MENKSECGFCCSKSASYTCPKCRVPYCSSSCYKNPNHARCSEEFYKDQVTLELQSCSSSDQSREEMNEILKRLESADVAASPSEDDIEDENYEDIGADDDDDSWQTRFGSLNLDDVDVATLWNKLTAEEQNEFTTMLEQDRVHEFVPLWIPWWTKKEPIIQELNTETSDTIIEVPRIPKLSELLQNSKPSELVCYNILNVLYTYVAVSRLHNGELYDLATDIAKTILTVSTNLGKNTNFNTVAESIDSARQQMLTMDSTAADSSFSTSIIQDLICIISGPEANKNSSEYSLAALMDLIKIFSIAQKNAQVNGMKQLKANCHKCVKKLQFYVSWHREYASNLCETLPSLSLLADVPKLKILTAIRNKSSEEVDTEAKALSDDQMVIKDVVDTRQENETNEMFCNRRKKVLVQDLSET